MYGYVTGDNGWGLEANLVQWPSASQTSGYASWVAAVLQHWCCGTASHQHSTQRLQSRGPQSIDSTILCNSSTKACTKACDKRQAVKGCPAGNKTVLHDRPPHSASSPTTPLQPLAKLSAYALCRIQSNLWPQLFS